MSAVLNRSRSLAPLVAVFVGVLLGGTAAWWSFPSPALAYICNGRYSTDATRQFGLDFADRGVRASTGEEVFGAGVDCVHAASALVITLAGDWVEVGWHTMQTGYPDCHTTGDDKPHVFYLRYVNSQQTCYENLDIPIAGGGYYGVSVRSDIGNNKPNQWIYDFDGHVLPESPDVGFSAGAGMTNSDRHFINSSDTSKEDARADFQGMQYRTGSDAWAGWVSEICSGPGYNNDSYYNNQLVQSTAEVQVSTNPAQCN